MAVGPQLSPGHARRASAFGAGTATGGLAALACLAVFHHGGGGAGFPPGPPTGRQALENAYDTADLKLALVDPVAALRVADVRSEVESMLADPAYRREQAARTAEQLRASGDAELEKHAQRMLAFAAPGNPSLPSALPKFAVLNPPARVGVPARQSPQSSEPTPQSKRVGASIDADGKSNVWAVEPKMTVVDTKEGNPVLKWGPVVGAAGIGAALIPLLPKLFGPGGFFMNPEQ
mmetsp:Transcript_113990/g.322719  ORF Transcript_113990/g.322719 Transcript_113990/m.322719 type:complete len:234 (+) Transcript_113990:76-777(+)|eukprot:CAMPEP_0179257144 /NCGR_PEP_ID=MMETSP0797-20121207/24635_1 /TAXON_ID=47934 /ORGANISM="Dinophysis acuminata, Strain DAEP01" /LENGTH=233 /DNA_ID=CAMNT_0020965109 /DNA_START=73 /DNA_END=774 /DNA_ORIENTATION=-